ncbi:MAG: hypothetical protein ACRD1R_17405 [Acidobacteriota bacterium]
MNILSLFRGSPQRQIQRARKKVKEPHGDPATRINAARRLLEMGTLESIRALLDRFTISASPSRQDEEEKAEVLSWIIELGDQAVPPLIQFLKRERQVYWPVRALKEILAAEEAAERINEVLQYHWENPPASPDPKAQLIRSSAELPSSELENTISLYLEDPDDDVRLAALDYLFSQAEEETREAILNAYLDSQDRPRIKAHILERLAANGWSVRGFRPGVEKTLPEGYALSREGTVKVIGGKG